GANILSNILFVIPLHMNFKLGHVGLALATSCSAMLNVYLLFRGLVKQGIYQVQPGFYRQVTMFCVAACLMGGMLFFGQTLFGVREDFTAFDRVWRLLLLCIAGVSVYFAVLFAGGVRVRHFKQSA
ncbi:MAG: polysaccharide biosynthesis C-terminal domain-containing protein, partial [Pseudomonadota bacterium]